MNETNLLRRIADKARPVRINEMKRPDEWDYYEIQDAWNFLRNRGLISRQRVRKTGDTFTVTARGHRVLMQGHDIVEHDRYLYLLFLNSVLTKRATVW